MDPKDPKTDPVRAVTCERLRWLSIGFYIRGAMAVFTVSIFLIHFFMLLVLSFVPESEWNETRQPEMETVPEAVPEAEEASSEREETEVPNYVEFLNEIQAQSELSPSQKGPPLPFFFRIIAGFVGFIILLGWTFGGLTLYAGRCISKRRKRTFVLIMAGLNCLSLPYGTFLGIATILALTTPDAKEEYGIEPARP